MKFKKNNIFDYILITYLLSLIFIWNLKSIIVDIIAFIVLIVFFMKKKSFPKIFYIISLFYLLIFISSLISNNIDSIFFILRYILHALATFISLYQLDTKKIVYTLILLQILTLPIGIYYINILSNEDPYNLYLLGYGLFSGAKNHFSYLIIGNYFLVLHLSNFSKLNKFMYFIFTLVELVYARSLTGFISFLISILIYYFMNNLDSIKNILLKLTNIYVFFAISVFFLYSDFISKINISLFNYLESLIKRLLNIASDESWNIRTKDLFNSFNNYLDSNFNLFGTGNYQNFMGLRPYDNSYYSVLIGGGFIITLSVLLMIMRNIFKAEKSNRLIIIIFIIYSFLFFVSANVLFEIQNIYPLILIFFGSDILNKKMERGVCTY